MQRTSIGSTSSSGGGAHKSQEAEDSSSSQLSGVSSDPCEPLQPDQHEVFLKSRGCFLDKRTTALEGGKLVTLWNFPLRGKHWAFVAACAHPKSGDLALADERGQVFHLSASSLRYESVRLASTMVSAMCFVVGPTSSSTHEVIVAYANGTVVVVDCLSKEIKSNIHLPHSSGGNGAVVRLLRSHPKQDVVLVVTEDNTVFLWNMQ
jgi:WD40 repeat protein